MIRVILSQSWAVIAWFLGALVISHFVIEWIG